MSKKKEYWVIKGVSGIIKGKYVGGLKNEVSYIEGDDGKKYEIRSYFKGYTSEEEAREAENEVQQHKEAGRQDISGAKEDKTANTATKHTLKEGTYIGSDEVGKVEPLKQLLAVAVYVKAENFADVRALGVDDSKKIPGQIQRIGKELTGFTDYEDIESGKVYTNDAYGLAFCPVILSNADYNKKHDEGINANAVVSELHNEANSRLYAKLKADGIIIKNIVIDDYINQANSRERFKNYLDNYSGEKITELTDTDIIFETKADGTYKEIVGTASDICAYIDSLWQAYLNKKYGMELDYGNRSNDISLKNSFAKIYSMDADMTDVKHTKTYESWKNQ